MDGFTTLGIIASVTMVFFIPAAGIVWIIALYLAHLGQPGRRGDATHTEINIHIHGDMLVQVDGGAQQRLAAHQVQALLADTNSRQTVRIVDPVRRTIEEYSRGQLVRRGELVSRETAITRRR